MTALELDIADIAKFLANHQPDLKPVNQRGHAAVAMLLRNAASSPEVLFIVRAQHDQDPWSGNIGFPGGDLTIMKRHHKKRLSAKLLKN